MKNLLNKVEKLPWSGCWIWMGALSANGYGNIHVRPKNIVAHRYFYEYAKGPVPSGLDLDHLCRVRCCVNPDHLQPVTRSENLRRGSRIGRKYVTAHPRLATHAESVGMGSSSMQQAFPPAVPHADHLADRMNP